MMPHAPQATSLQPMINDSHALLAQLVLNMRQTQMQANVTQNQYQAWRGQARPQAFLRSGNVDDNSITANLLEAVLSQFVMGDIFGIPLTDTAQGLMMAAQSAHGAESPTRYPQAQVQRYENDALIEQAYAMFYGAAMDEQQQKQAQAAKLQETLMLLLLSMILEQKNAHAAAQKPKTEEVVPDVLRHPRVARFKQNRHSIDCIREAFSRQVETMMPRFDKPRYRPAA